MVQFLINTPNHKRWWLPDRVHQFNSFIYGDHEHWSVLNSFTQETVLSGRLSLDDPQWRDLSTCAQELATKRFAAKRDRQVRDYQRSYRK